MGTELAVGGGVAEGGAEVLDCGEIAGESKASGHGALGLQVGVKLHAEVLLAGHVDHGLEVRVGAILVECNRVLLYVLEGGLEFEVTAEWGGSELGIDHNLAAVGAGGLGVGGELGLLTRVTEGCAEVLDGIDVTGEGDGAGALTAKLQLGAALHLEVLAAGNDNLSFEVVQLASLGEDDAVLLHVGERCLEGHFSTGGRQGSVDLDLTTPAAGGLSMGGKVVHVALVVEGSREVLDGTHVRGEGYSSNALISDLEVGIALHVEVLLAGNHDLALEVVAWALVVDNNAVLIGVPEWSLDLDLSNNGWGSGKITVQLDLSKVHQVEFGMSPEVGEGTSIGESSSVLLHVREGGLNVEPAGQLRLCLVLSLSLDPLEVVTVELYCSKDGVSSDVSGGGEGYVVGVGDGGLEAEDDLLLGASLQGHVSTGDDAVHAEDYIGFLTILAEGKADLFDHLIGASDHKGSVNWAVLEDVLDLGQLGTVMHDRGILGEAVANVLVVKADSQVTDSGKWRLDHEASGHVIVHVE